MDKKRSRPSSKKSTIRPFTAVPTRSERIVELTPAKRLEKEESVMKPEISGPAQIPSGLHPMSQSAVGFETANKHAAKDSVRPPVQQAWESPPTSPKRRMSTAIPPYSPGHKRGMKKVENAKDLSYVTERTGALCVRKDKYAYALTSPVYVLILGSGLSLSCSSVQASAEVSGEHLIL